MAAFPAPDPAIENRIREIGGRLFATMDATAAPGRFSREAHSSRLMDWAMRDPAFKLQLFRFIDVLPALKSNAEIVRHLQEYLGDRAVDLNPALKAGLAASSLAPALVAAPVKASVAALAAQFVAGETPDDLVQQLRRNAQLGIATTIDLLGETVVSDAEADAFLQRNLDLLDTVARALAGDTAPGFSDLGPAGPLPRLNLSLKISALAPELPPAAPERSLVALKKRLRPILRRAAELGAFVNFDMESHRWKDLTLALFKSAVEEYTANQPPAGPVLGIALQAYRRDSEHDLRDLIAWARKHSRPVGVRLVKGAYWDHETILAAQRGWPSPVWSRKAETDANFEKLSTLLLENSDAVAPAFATHNVRSCAHAIAQAARLNVNPRACEFQALFGMADDLKRALIAHGHRVREYCAIGALLPGMAYLVRRRLENTSNESFLRHRAPGDANRDELLRHPLDRPGSVSSVSSTHAAAADDFRNTATTDFTLVANRERQRAALHAWSTRLGKRHPLVIAGREIADREFIASVNPAHPEQVVGYWARASVADADAAIAAARIAFPAWRATPVRERAAMLERAADLIASRRFELNALEILEAGKPWGEADADVSEAIDFCRFYAHKMRRLDTPEITARVPGEECVRTFTPRGVGVAIAPWNFPLAILTGLTVAPLVAGNCVIMKPAEQTTVIAAVLMEILREAGASPGVLHFVPGFGEDVGAHLAAHPHVDFVAFTGSRAVGLKVRAAGGRTLPSQENLKHVICEMGGKNALVIDDDADLDEAIPAALQSAFGYSGQKCSALSRLIVLDGIHDEFVSRFTAACASVPIGDPADPGTVVGPVIDAEAQRKILDLIEHGMGEARLGFRARVAPELLATGGYYVPPTVFVGVTPDAVIAREEIFGPVVSVLRARDLDEAFALANGVDYALTGGIFSRSPHALARARRELLVGNLYLNRGITGALVGRHPFGGFRHSGGGTQAGGRGYLENFLFPRTIAENVLRRGFAPPESDG
jgi:RHH-type proline utilization regulon transcriptional repressor/proline dehydrogenase/delta 1-pyrroline-5-carboxylate dehydrogenase